MTKLNGIHQQILQRMREQILDSLKNGPRMVNDISDELDCSRSTIDKRLHELKEDGVVVCTKQSRRGIGGWHLLWHLPSVSVEQAVHAPRQVKKAPAPVVAKAAVVARDALTAALFGPSRRESI